MKFFETHCEIAAPSARVWSILTDTRRLVAGGMGLTRLDGAIAPNGRIKLWSEAAPNRAFSLRVTQFQPPHSMTWSGGMPLGLFKGERTFTLADSASGTSFRMREEYSGLILRLIWKSIPDLNPSFGKFAAGLKRLAEA